MTTRKQGTVMSFSPGMGGLVDAYDSTKKFPGACTSLQNLIQDQINPEFVVSRPGTLSLASFAAAGFLTPTFIPIQVAIGTYVYGMVTTTLHAGFDQPFVYNTVTGAFLTVTGITGINVPTSPTTTGDWAPPTLDNIGTMIVITHPGFNGGNGYYGVIDISNLAAPAWRSENTTTNALPCVPTCVANFNDRAWFSGSAVGAGTSNYGNWVFYTDILTNPLTRTNATQSLVIGDNNPLNKLSGLPAQTTSSGIVQSLTAFKKTQIWQITGDTTQSNLSLNFLSLTIGTLMPRTVVQCPIGLYFISTAGPYFINLLGAVLPLVYAVGQDQQPDVQVPFQNAIYPTRWAAAYGSSIYRVCGLTIINNFQFTGDYWFDEHKRRWSGPHSFAYDCASPFGGLFILSSATQPGTLILSSPIANTGFPNTDLGVAMPFNLQSSTFPKSGDMYTKQVVESQIELSAINGAVTYTITAQDGSGRQIGQVPITVGAGVPIWGAPGLLWGFPPVGSGAIYTPFTSQYVPLTFPVPWTAPLVFEKMQLNITGTVTANLGIGTFMARYQKTGYMTQAQVSGTQ